MKKNAPLEVVLIDTKVSKERISFLFNLNIELEQKIKENRESFIAWLDANFKNKSVDSDRVTIKDEENDYLYSMEDNVLRMKKYPKTSNKRNGCGFGHPMELYFDMFDKKEKELEEIFYEGNEAPKKPEVLFEKLKADLIERGEISMTIKKYINEDRKMRIELRDEISKNINEIADLEYKNRKALQDALKSEFTKEKLTELFKEKKVLTNGEKYIFKPYGNNKVKTITFKKETSDNYYLELVFENNDEEVAKTSKSKFNIVDYFSL